MKKQNKMEFKEMNNKNFNKFSKIMIDSITNNLYIKYGYQKALDEVEKLKEPLRKKFIHHHPHKISSHDCFEHVYNEFNKFQSKLKELREKK